MNEKLNWLLNTHYSHFHAEMIQRAMCSDNVPCVDFIRGCVDIYISERDRKDNTFVPDVFKNV